MGSFSADKLQKFTGHFNFTAGGVSGSFLSTSSPVGVFDYYEMIGGASLAYQGYSEEEGRGISFDVSRVARTGAETAPASISTVMCISY